MTFKEWKSLQDEYGIIILDSNYENMSVEEGKQLLEALIKGFYQM